MLVRTILREVRIAWSDSAPLTATALLMLLLFAGSLAGIALDDRIITGAPAWLKPAKFAISMAIFCASLAWLYRYIAVWPRFVRAMGWIVSSVLVLEIAIIDIQAARGTTSHFNFSTTLDEFSGRSWGLRSPYSGLRSIGILTALFRQKFDNAAWGWWLRMGMLVTVLGSAAGGLMVPPSPQQVQALRAGEPVRIVGGSHGRSARRRCRAARSWLEHGTRRPAHPTLPGPARFADPAISRVAQIAAAKTRGDGNGSTLAFAATASYVGFVLVLTWQALRGQSIVSPDAGTLLALGVWLAATVGSGIYLHRSDAATDTLHSLEGAQHERRVAGSSLRRSSKSFRIAFR